MKIRNLQSLHEGATMLNRYSTEITHSGLAK